MNMYIWKFTGPVNARQHDDGGLMIAAPSLSAARGHWQEHVDGSHYGYSPIEDASATDDPPDYVFLLDESEQEDLVLIFPNAGCC